MRFRTARQTSALPLTAQEPLNNTVGAGIQTLAAVFGGVQSIHTTGYDEIREETETTESRREAKVPLGVIYSGVYPFMISLVICVALLFLFHPIPLFLPYVLMAH